MPESKAQRTAAITRSIASGQRQPLSYFDSRQYVQHNVHIGDGLSPILEFMDALPPERTRSDVLRAFEDGDYSIVHADYELGDWGPMVGFEIHRWERERITEHWDNLCSTPPTLNSSGRSMIDGATELADLDRTEHNRALVHRFASEVLLSGQLSAPATFFHQNDLIQHSPAYGDGVDTFRSELARWLDQHILHYQRIHKILGQGNFFLVMSEGRLRGEPAALFDLYRVSNNVIAEHWEVFETIPPRSEWANENGKF